MGTRLFAEASLCCREAREKEGRLGRKRARHDPRRPASFQFFDYCYFYCDTQRERLRRREGISCTIDLIS